MLAYTGLETVANLAEEARRPGVDLPRSLFVAIGTVVTVYVAIAVVGLSAFPGHAHTRSARRGLARAARRGSSTRSAHLAGLVRRRAALLRRRERRADPARGGDDLDLRLLAARLLARRARPAAARLRAAAPAHARLAAGDPLRGRDLERDRDRDGVRQARRQLPRERLLVRRPARVHGRAARGDQAPDRRAGPAAALPRPVQLPCRPGGDPDSRGRRRGADLRGLDRRDGDTSRRALRRPRVARWSASSSSSPSAAPTAKA